MWASLYVNNALLYAEIFDVQTNLNLDAQLLLVKEGPNWVKTRAAFARCLL
jgi:hypothetical protein